jgi:hypothetical protein
MSRKYLCGIILGLAGQLWATLLVAPLVPSEQAIQYATEQANDLRASLRSLIQTPWAAPPAQKWYESELNKLRAQYPIRVPQSTTYQEYQSAKSYLQAERNAREKVESMRTSIKNSALLMTYLPTLASITKTICQIPSVASGPWATKIAQSNCIKFLLYPPSMFTLGFMGILANTAYQRAKLASITTEPELTNIQEQFYW